jgi:AcrR family transcriptional regulator
MGRPRSARAHKQVIDAALALFAERGVDATSMDAIAEASGVSKATIYKHWPDKGALCIEVMTHLACRDQPPPVPDSGDTRADLIAALAGPPESRDLNLRSRIMPHLTAYAMRDPSFGEAWRARIFDPPRVLLVQVLRRGIARGEFPLDLDLDLAASLLLGPMMYGHVMRRMRAEVPDDHPRRVVDAFWKAHAIALPPAPRPKKRAKPAPGSA